MGAESSLKGMREAASKEASQFQQYEREKATLEEDLEEAQKLQADNLQRARQIRADAVIARNKGKEKLYVGEEEVRRLESVLQETKVKTAEHMQEAELLQQWEARLPVAHLNQ